MEIQEQKTKDNMDKMNIQVAGSIMQMALLLPEIFNNPSDILTMSLEAIDKKVEGKEFHIWNDTDGITTDHRTFEFLAAVKFIKEFPKRYKHQGYYRDNKWNKMNPLHVRLVIKPTLC